MAWLRAPVGVFISCLHSSLDNSEGTYLYKKTTEQHFTDDTKHFTVGAECILIISEYFPHLIASPFLVLVSL